MCRAVIGGVVTSELPEEGAVASLTVPMETEPPSFKDTLSQSVTSLMGATPGVFKAVLAVLMSLEHHNALDTSVTECFRVIVAVPHGIEYKELCKEFHRNVPSGRAWLSHFCTTGTVHHRVTFASIERQLHAFQCAEGPRFKVLFTTEGAKDSMVGLDMNNVDALISVGTGNCLQRIGRLTRLGRKFSRNVVHHFELQPQ